MIITEYKTYRESEILPLYESVGWSAYTSRPEMLRESYKGSLLTLAAYEGDDIVGIIRTVGDGVSIVYIQDIIVSPSHQRHGIGTALLHEVIMRYENVYQLILMTDDTPKTVAFYHSCGFTSASDINCLGFMKVNYK